MKRKILSILAIVLIVLLSSLIVACDSPSYNSGGNYGDGYENSNSNNITNNSACTHSWSDATCEMASKCYYCGKTSGGSLGHNWNEATCQTPKTCQRCGKTSGQKINHNFVNGSCSMCDTLDPKNEQFNSGKTIYGKLNAVNLISSDMASSIYEAWYFAIYEADNKNYLFNTDKAITDFASSVGIKKDAITKAIDQYLTSLGYEVTDTTRLAVLGTNSGAVNIVLIAYENTGIKKVIEENFSIVKSLLKEMSSAYEEVTYYSTLKQYYSDSLAYYDFVTSPSGSFSQLATTLKGHTSKLVEHKNDLSFIYEE